MSEGGVGLEIRPRLEGGSVKANYDALHDRMPKVAEAFMQLAVHEKADGTVVNAKRYLQGVVSGRSKSASVDERDLARSSMSELTSGPADQLKTLVFHARVAETLFSDSTLVDQKAIQAALAELKQSGGVSASEYEEIVRNARNTADRYVEETKGHRQFVARGGKTDTWVTQHVNEIAAQKKAAGSPSKYVSRADVLYGHLDSNPLPQQDKKVRDR